MPACLDLALHGLRHVPCFDSFGGGQRTYDVDERVQGKGGWLGDAHEVGPRAPDLLVGWCGHATLRTLTTAALTQQSGPRAKHVDSSGGGRAGFTDRQNIRGQRPGVWYAVGGWPVCQIARSRSRGIGVYIEVV